MAELPRVVVTLRFVGRDLDPDETSLRLLSPRNPDVARRAGDSYGTPSGRELVSKTGHWAFHLDQSPGDIDQQIIDLLGGFTPDLAVWHDLSQRYDGELHCGLWLDAEEQQNENLDRETLKLIADRQLHLGLEFYRAS